MLNQEIKTEFEKIHNIETAKLFADKLFLYYSNNEEKPDSKFKLDEGKSNFWTASAIEKLVYYSHEFLAVKDVYLSYDNFVYLIKSKLRNISCGSGNITREGVYNLLLKFLLPFYDENKIDQNFKILINLLVIEEHTPPRIVELKATSSETTFQNIQ